LVAPDLEPLGGFDPVGFEFMESGLGGAPAGDGDNALFFGEVVAPLADDFAKTSSQEVSSDGFSGLFRGDEAEVPIIERWIVQATQHEKFSSGRLASLANDLKLAPLAHAPLTSQVHDRVWKPE
jgi:hypothetical protein